MAKQFSFENPAFQGIAGRKITYPIPEEGELVNLQNQTLGFRKGNVFYILRPQDIISPEEWKTFRTGGEISGAAINKFLEQAGVSKSSLTMGPGYWGSEVDMQRAGLRVVRGGLTPEMVKGYKGGFTPPGKIGEELTTPGAKTYKDVPGYGETPMPAPPTLGALTEPSLGKELPFPKATATQTAQQVMEEYQEKHTFTGGKWYEGKGVAPVAPTGEIAGIKEKAATIEERIKGLQDIITRATEAGYGPGTGRDIPDEFFEGTGVEPPDVVGVGEGEMPDWATVIMDMIDKRWAEKPDIPPFTWTDADTAAVKAEFEDMFGPYYAQMAAVPKRGAREAIEELEKTAGLALKRESRNLEEALSESRAAMAMRGLAFSGIREKEEVKEKEISAEEMERIRDVAARGRRGEIAGLEAQIGTEATRGLYPGYQIAPEYAGVVPGYEGIPGSIPTEKALSYRQELARREAEARQAYLSDILMQEYYS